ncbi:hypothetical protein [Nonomuraea roseoviolacea]|uniref:Uncharacterized protein n=1 Tax=Nonomuraea roseoviolacea subsp. carminata TaxID=160689 RepID=A0ABT1JXQ9_9ACTN|nr:hypothetical protein [Nonomuraea roseoviolacea]MCP2346390.1 hypothetical protein [Nonomuraea roseoviolacea subsp. carminata]
MGLDLGLVPEVVKPLALPLTANAFPEGEPDAITRQAGALEALADELAGIRAEDAEPLLSRLSKLEWEGAAKEEFEKVLADLAGEGHKASSRKDNGGETLLRLLEKALREEAQRLRKHGETTEHTQWMQYAALALLGLAIVRLLVWIIANGPSVLRLIQLRTIMTRMSIQALKWRLLMNILGFGGMMGLTDLTVQELQKRFGHREDIDGHSVLMSFLNGAMMGLVYTGVDFGLSRLATREVVFIMSRAELGVRDQIAAIGQSIYGRAVVGGFSGAVGSVPGLAVSDQLDPAHLFYSFVAGTAGGIGIPQSARVSFMPTAAGDLPPNRPPSGGPAWTRTAGGDGPPPVGGHKPPSSGDGSSLGLGSRRVVEPTQVVLSGETAPAAGRPADVPMPPKGDGGSAPAPAREAEMIAGEVVRREDGPSEGPLPPPDTRMLHGPAPELPGAASHTAGGATHTAGGSSHTAGGAHDTSGHAPAAGLTPDAPVAGRQPHAPNGTPAGHPQNTAPAGHPANGTPAGHPQHTAPAGTSGHANAAGTPGHANGAGHTPLAPPQPVRDALPLHTPYVQTAPAAPVPPLPPTDAQNGATDASQDNDRGQAARHGTGHSDGPRHPDTPQPTDQPRPVTPRDGSDTPAAPRDDAANPRSTDPARVTHAQDVASGRAPEGQPLVTGRLPDTQAPGRGTDGQIRDAAPAGTRETPPARAGDQRTTPPARQADQHATSPTHPGGGRTTAPDPAPEQHPTPHPDDPTTTPPATPDGTRQGGAHEDAPAVVRHGNDAGPGTGRIDQLINRDEHAPAALDPARVALGHRVARLLEEPVPHDTFAHSLGTMAHIVTQGVNRPTGETMAGGIRAIATHLGMPYMVDGLVRVFDEAQRQGHDPAGATDRQDLTDRLDQYRQTDPLVFPGLWLAHRDVPNVSFPVARALARMDQALGSHPTTDLADRLTQLRSLAYDADVGFHSIDHVGRLFVDAQARGIDVRNAPGWHELRQGLRQARQHDTDLWDGLRAADEHAMGGLGDPEARALGRAGRLLHSVSPDARLRDLAADAGFSHAYRSFSEMLAEADAHGALPERPATRRELVDSLASFRDRDGDGWDLRVMEERFPDARLDPAKAATLGRLDRVIVADAAPRPAMDPLLVLARELGLGDSPRRLAHAADRARRLGFDPAGAPDRATLVARMRGYMDTAPDTWARVRVSERYATQLGEPTTRALARMDRIVGSRGKAPAWVLDPLRKLAGDLGLDHSVERLAHVFQGAEQRGLDPGGAVDRADLVQRLSSYHRAAAEKPYHFTVTLLRVAEDALMDQLRQAAARDAAFARASLTRAGGAASDLENAHVQALEARARAWESWPAEPEVSYRENPEVFERHLAEAFERAESGEPVVPLMIEEATDGLTVPGGQFKFAREIEYTFPEALDRHRDAINQAIARDLYDAGLTLDPWVHPYHTSRDTGYYEGDNGWRLEREGTAAGELVPPPLRYTERAWQAVKLVCEIIKSHGGEATMDAGGHIHAGTSVFDHVAGFYQRLLQLENITFADTTLRLLTNPEQQHHRGTEFCRPNALLSRGYASLDGLVNQHKKHLAAVNLAAVKGGRTDHTEFRRPDASLDPGVIQAQTKLVLAELALALRLADDQFPLNNGEKDLPGSHADHRRSRDYSSYFELADLLFHREADKAQLTALFAITRWNEKKEARYL